MIDIAIVGGGPAGLCAGMYAARAGVDVVMFEEIYSGGQITKTDVVENYPGFETGIDGFSLANKFEVQAKRFGLKIENKRIDKLELNGDVKILISGSERIEAKRVIIATGAEPRPVGLEHEAELVGAGVSYCATCDGALFRGKDVLVVGGGDTAISDALYLSKFTKSVTVVHRRDALRASQVLQDAAKKAENIHFEYKHVPKAFVGDERVEGLVVENVETGIRKTLEASAVFIAVGTTPRSAFAQGAMDLTETGYIITNMRMETSLEGVFAVGDVRDTPLRQVVTAVADGAVAAMMAVESLMR